jgi:ABC-type phosphate transport system substrate-binding protein
MLKVIRPPNAAGRARKVAHCAGLALAAAVVATTLSPREGAAQIAVVVNSANPVDELSIDKLRRLYLGQAATFPSGQHARLATHTPSVAAFDRTALELPPEIVRSRWMAIVFRGEATAMPATLASTDDVKKFVADHPDAIAYLPLAAVDGSLKVLRIDGRRPGDAGYPIR